MLKQQQKLALVQNACPRLGQRPLRCGRGRTSGLPGLEADEDQRNAGIEGMAIVRVFSQWYGDPRKQGFQFELTHVPSESKSDTNCTPV